ncbi:hypothetical protein Tco_1163186 [Tanacetum coccineum]
MQEETIHKAAMETKEPVEGDVVNAEGQPQDVVVPKQDNSIWFNDGFTVDSPMFAKNHLKKDKITKADLEGPALKLLKASCRNYIELEYNMEHCYLALTYQPDWTNLQGDRVPYNLSKPLSLQGPPGHTTIPVDLFINKDLEYLKNGNTKKRYASSLTKPKAARYDLEGLKEMIPNLRSSSKEGYDLYASLGINHWILSITITFAKTRIRYWAFEEGCGGEQTDLVTALRFFIRRIVLERRVEDVQLRVKSYQTSSTSQGHKCDVDGAYSALASEEEEIEKLVRRKSSTSSRVKSIKITSDTQGADHTVTIPPCFLHAAAPQEYPPKLSWLTEAVDLEWVAEPSTQLQTQNEILEVDQSISLQYGPQTGNHDVDSSNESATQDNGETKNHDVDSGNESATQDNGETKNDDPAGHMSRLVLAFLAFYGVMLGYLGWGPTNSSPRKSYPIYFWVSIGMLAYVTFALFGVLRMHKIGGTWTWWAKFLGFTIYPAALIGCAMLIVLVSLH